MNDTIQKNRQFWLICLLLALVTLAVFWQVTNNEFINYDDDRYITQNPWVQAGLTLQGIKWAFTTSHAGYWHPLTWLSHMLDYQLFGLQPAGHHVVNLFFHVANTLLLFLVLHRMTKALWQSAFTAALFALHPLHVESVAWVAERKDVLSAFFFMLTMGAYIRYVGRPGIPRYLLVFVLFMLGLMSKPMLVTLPFVLLLLDYWPLGRLQPAKPASDYTPASVQKNSGRKKRKAAKGSAQSVAQHKEPRILHQWSAIRFLVLEKAPLFALSAISSVITFYHQQKEGAMAPLQEIALDARVGNALISYVGYLGKMIWPRNLAIFYPHPGVAPVLYVFGAALILVTITILVMWEAKRYPWLAVGWFWFLGTLVPVIGLVQVGMQAMADRYTYVPFIGLFIAVAWGAPELLGKWRHRKTALAASACAVLFAFIMVTWVQLQYWQNSITLLRHAISVTTDNSEAHLNLGVALRDRGEINEAEYHYREALRINSDDERAHFDLGNLLLANGKMDEAILHYNEALRITPDYGKAHAKVGVAFMFQGRLKEAAAHYQKAISLGTADAWTYFNLGVVFYQTGQVEEAVNQYRKAILVKPDFAEAYNELGGILGKQGKTEEAIGYFKKAITLKPDFAAARHNLAVAQSAYNKR